jgi:hypothetical protein
VKIRRYDPYTCQICFCKSHAIPQMPNCGFLAN